MNYNYRKGYGDKQILEINDARIIFRNFSGVGDKYNREGDRNFSVVIPNVEIAEALKKDGWNVKEKEAEDGSVLYRLPVKVSYANRGPAIYVVSGNNDPVRLDENTVDMLDNIDIMSVDMDINPYHWELRDGTKGVAAYLDAMRVVQNVDRFGAMYANKEEAPF